MDLSRSRSLGQFQSLLPEVQSTGNSSSNLIQKKTWGSTDQHETAEVARKTNAVTLSAKTNEEQQRKLMPEHHPLSVGLYLYSF